MSTLEEVKKEIKKWEHAFCEKHGAKPNKNDLKEAPVDIKVAYQQFWKLKNAIQNVSPKSTEDVWSSKFNKSNNANVKQQDGNMLEKFKVKLKHQSSNCLSKNFRPLSGTKKKVGELCSNDSPEAKASLLNVKEVSNDNSSSIDCKSNICWDINKDMKSLDATIKTIRIAKDADVHRSLLRTNVVSSFTHLPITKRSNFSSNVNRSWLDRCSDVILSSTGDIKNINNVNDNPSSLTTDCQKPQSKKELSLSEAVGNSSLADVRLNSVEESARTVIESTFAEGGDSTTPSEGKINSRKRRRSSSPELPQSQNAVETSDSLVAGISQHSDVFSHVESTVIKPVVKKAKESREADINSHKITASLVGKQNHLKRKISSGTVNENFVRLNIKKKVFVRGHRHVNVRKMKFAKWKQLKKNSGAAVNGISSSACYQCGQMGHWSRNCPSKKESMLLPDCEDDFTLPTLEEAAEMCEGIKPTNSSNLHIKTVKIFEKDATSNMEEKEGPLENVALCDVPSLISKVEDEVKITPVLPFFEATAERTLSDLTSEVYEALEDFGYSEFRDGQEEAILRVLCGKSTLVVLPTGSGKSLCYQLPAYLYAKKNKCITLVVSPLVSLMEDQVTGLPSCIRAAFLHSGMSESQKSSSLKDITEGNVQIVLISPEAIIGGGRCLPTNLPPIAFACIDEAHCLSEWSHNFRPSYFQLYKVLSRKHQVGCFLGLTATATQNTAVDIARNLKLDNYEESVIGKTGVPSNLHVSVSRDKDIDGALIKLLQGDRFSYISSIIIYCIRRNETERIATLIRTTLQNEITSIPVKSDGKSKKSKKLMKSLDWNAEAYHAGLTPARRRSVQKKFMSGKLRVVVATVAFGMGLDKSSIGAVIHYNMPKSFESYVQEIGRAGRDGTDAQCHVFLRNEGKDLSELKRHIYSNGIDRHTIRKLLKKIFVPCKCLKMSGDAFSDVEMEDNSNENQNLKCPKHEIAFSVNCTVQELDLKEECISTLMCYLELHEEHWIEQLSPTYSICTIRCYGGPKQMLSLVKKCPAIAVAMALDKQNNKEWNKSAKYEFDIIQVASYMGWESGAVKRELKCLEWNDYKKKTGVIVEFSDLAFHLRAPGNLVDEELDKILDFLYTKITLQEKMELQKLHKLYSVFHRYSASHYWACCDEVNTEQSSAIKEEIKSYFESCNSNEHEIEDKDSFSAEQHPCSRNDEENLDHVQQHIRNLIHTNHDQKFTGRAIARVFHGIGSPCYPAEVWGRVRKFWRCYLNIDFHLILKMSNTELKNLH